MRYYLDTNILVFLKTSDFSEISKSVRDALDDYGNTFYTSSVCVQELIHLCQIEKVSELKGHKRVAIDASDIIPWLNEAGIEVKPVTTKHLERMAQLPLTKDHHDPFDRLIIAQAITDGVEVITSDHKFSIYERYGLKITFNER